MLRTGLSLLCLGAVLVGCDALDTPATQPGETAQVRVVRTPTGVALEAPAARTVAGDFHFRLDRVPAGSVVSADLNTTADAPRLEYLADGGHVRMIADGADAVEVSYLADGREVASSLSLAAAEDGVYNAGSSAAGPTSFHYVRDADGAVSIRWDYTKGGDAETGPIEGRSAMVRTPDGESVRVTDVQFTAWGLDLGTVESVKIESPRAIHIAEARVQR